MKYKVITAIICITLLEAWALYLGFNGTMLTVVVAALAGLAGYEMKGGNKDGR